MKTSRRSGSRAKRQGNRLTGNLSQAILLSPSQVANSLANMSDRQRGQLTVQWLLTGTVSKKMFAGLVANTSCELATEITFFERPSGAAYVLITCQLDNWQHRFVLPLYDARVREYLAVDILEPLSIQLSCVGSNEAFVFDCLISRHELKCILEIGRMVDLKDRDSLFFEWANLLGDILKPAGRPSLSATQRVRNVDVSALIPAGSNGHFDNEMCLKVAA
jgi:hypothetical protein